MLRKDRSEKCVISADKNVKIDTLKTSKRIKNIKEVW